MGVMFDAMFPKFSNKSKKDKKDDVPPIVTEPELLLVNGRGINTWYVVFHGNTDEGENVDFSYRLNITSVQFGMKAVRMYDSLLTATFDDEIYSCVRDYAMIKNKQHVPLDYLSFMGNLSKIEGNFSLLDLYAVMTNYEVDVAMDYPDGIVKKGFFADSDDVNEPQDMLAADMDCQGMMLIEGKDCNVKGHAWVEKRYKPVPKNAGNDVQGSIKLWLFPTESESEVQKHIAIESKYDESLKAEKVQALVISSDGSSEVYEAESLFQNSTERWESTLTGKKYPLPMTVRVSDIGLEIEIEPSVYEQEMLAEDGVYSEYVGSGRYSGTCGGEAVSGYCGIEMVGI